MGDNNLKDSHQSVTGQGVSEPGVVTHGASAISALATTAASFPLTLRDSNYPEASHLHGIATGQAWLGSPTCTFQELYIVQDLQLCDFFPSTAPQ